MQNIEVEIPPKKCLVQPTIYLYLYLYGYNQNLRVVKLFMLIQPVPCPGKEYNQQCSMIPVLVGSQGMPRP